MTQGKRVSAEACATATLGGGNSYWLQLSLQIPGSVKQTDSGLGGRRVPVRSAARGPTECPGADLNLHLAETWRWNRIRKSTICGSLPIPATRSLRRSTTPSTADPGAEWEVFGAAVADGPGGLTEPPPVVSCHRGDGRSNRAAVS